MWPPENLMEHTDQLRKLIAADRKTYADFRKWLYPNDLVVWQVVGDALKIRARYYRGEMLRAKNDTKRYVLGEDPKKPDDYGNMLADELTTELRELRDPSYYNEAMLLDAKLNIIKQITQSLERRMYG